MSDDPTGLPKDFMKKFRAGEFDDDLAAAIQALTSSQLAELSRLLLESDQAAEPMKQTDDNPDIS